jgi:rhomboid protease GluP
MPRRLRDAVVPFVRACPITTAVMGLAVALALAESAYRFAVDDNTGSRHALGGAVRLTYENEPQLHGPLALWEGEWWRIPASAFHHGGPSDLPLDALQWLHLGLNCLALGYLGRLLEPRMRQGVYMLFVLAGVVVPLLPEFLLEHSVAGLSGLACALFGAALMLRRHDPAVAEELPASAVALGFTWLLLCVPLTLLDIAPIANAAHFAGLAYGGLAGQMFFGKLVSPGWRAGFAAAHLAIVPAVYFAAHPVWIGRYHWYLAHVADEPRERVAHWQRAVERDASLEQLWWYLARHHQERDATLDAWRTVLAGLDANRTSERGDWLARRLWRQLRESDVLRDEARQILAERFGPEQAAWRARLGIPPVTVPPLSDAELPSVIAARATRRDVEPDPSRYRLDRPVELAPPDSAAGSPRDLSAPPLDPEDPESAALGRKL